MAAPVEAGVARRILSYVAFWSVVIVALVPFFFSGYHDWLYIRLQADLPRRLFVFGAVLIQIGELGLLVAVLREVRARVSHPAALVALLVPLLVYGQLIALSHVYLGRIGAFMPARVLRLAPFIFSDPIGFVGDLSGTDQARLGAVVLGSVVLAGLGLVGARPSSRRWQFRAGLYSMVFGAVYIGMSYIALPVDGRSMARQALKDGVSPSITYWWGPLLIPETGLDLQTIPPTKWVELDGAPRVQVGSDAPDLLVFVLEGLREDRWNDDVLPKLHSWSKNATSFSGVAQAPETSESMIVMLTGRYSLRSGARDMRVDPNGRRSVLEDLQQAGYRTGFFGEAWPIDAAFYEKGVDMRVDPLEEGTARSYLAADAQKLDRLLASAAHPEPIAAFVYLQGSHYPYSQVGIEGPKHPSEPEHDHSFLGFDVRDRTAMENAYDNTLTALDDQLGTLIQSWSDKRGGRPGWVIVTGDHGEAFGDFGEQTHGRRLVPSVVRVPIHVASLHERTETAEGSRAPSFAAHVDIAPSLRDAAGLPVDDRMQGRSLLREHVPGRPIFTSSQLYVSQDAVTEDGRLVVLDHRTGALRPYGFDGRSVTDEQARRLCGCIVTYRASQFDYYDALQARSDRFKPPGQTTCAPSPEARALCTDLPIERIER